MKRYKFNSLILVAFLIGFATLNISTMQTAYAQDAPAVVQVQQTAQVPIPDITLLFASVAALAAFVVALVGYIKANLLPNIGGWQVQALTLGVCIVIPALGWAFGLYQPVAGIKELLGFAFSAFVMSAGGYQALKQAVVPKQVQ